MSEERTFDEVFEDHRLTPAERRELVYRLAAIRAQKTIETLLHKESKSHDR